ncbi:DUF3016 domain-containing protein [Thiolapillus sp.]
MKKAILILAGLTILPIVALAGGNAKVNWLNPEDYKDVITSDGSQEEFVAHTLKELETTITRLAESLPDGQTLEMNVTDLDLAGDVKISGARTQHQDVRVVKDSYPARMKFHYRLLDASGKVLKEGDEKLQSRTLSASMRTGSSESLGMEKRMLRSWFKRTFAK